VSVSVGTPPVDQPIVQPVNAGQLVLTCDVSGTETDTAVTECPTIEMPAITLNGKTQVTSHAINPIFVADGRGDVTVGWSLSAFMINTGSGYLGFDNTEVGADLTLPNNHIPAANLSLDNVACAVVDGAPVAQVATQGPGGTLEVSRGLCSADPTHAGGLFQVTGTFNLTVPAYVAAGSYGGTVEYLVV
jgi:hypothetical protein